MLYCNNVLTSFYRMVTIFQMANVLHVTVILLAPTIVFVIRPVASVVACQMLRVGDVMQHRQDFSSDRLTTPDLKQKAFPIRRYHTECIEEALMLSLLP